MMSHPKVRLIVALSAAAIIASASTAQAANKKKSFGELLSPSISVATVSSGASRISQMSLASRAAASNNAGIHSATARGDLTLREYRHLVFRELVNNRQTLFASLRLYQRELRTGQLSFALYNLSRLNALTIWTGYSAAFRSEYATGTPYYFTSPIGVGPKSILPGPAYLPGRTIIPPITTIR